ncbi:MAG: hypothetical protein AB7G25_18990 [Sphingomonadaceae bacterium]
MFNVKLMSLIGMAGLLSGCGSTGSIQEAPLKPIEGVAASTAPCPVIASRDWRARLNRQGGASGKYTLTIDGEVELPTQGFTPVWQVGLSDRANPPNLQILLSFDPPPEDEMVMQVVSLYRVHHSVEVSSPRYREILIRCGTTALVRMPARS